MMKSVFVGASGSVVGLLLVVPNLAGLIAMIIVSRHSDRTSERRYHMAAAGALAGVGLLLLDASPSPLLSVVLFSAVAIGSYGFLPVFFSVPGEFLSGFPAAAGIALVTSVANLGGFVGPYVVGSMQGRTGRAGCCRSFIPRVCDFGLAPAAKGAIWHQCRPPTFNRQQCWRGRLKIKVGGALRIFRQSARAQLFPLATDDLSCKGGNDEIRPQASHSDRASI
jgi:MFS family permease